MEKLGFSFYCRQLQRLGTVAAMLLFPRGGPGPGILNFLHIQMAL